MSFHTVLALAVALCTAAIVAGDYQLRKFTSFRDRTGSLVSSLTESHERFSIRLRVRGPLWGAGEHRRGEWWWFRYEESGDTLCLLVWYWWMVFG